MGLWVGRGLTVHRTVRVALHSRPWVCSSFCGHSMRVIEIAPHMMIEHAMALASTQLCPNTVTKSYVLSIVTVLSFGRTLESLPMRGHCARRPSRCRCSTQAPISCPVMPQMCMLCTCCATEMSLCVRRGTTGRDAPSRVTVSIRGERSESVPTVEVCLLAFGPGNIGR